MSSTLILNHRVGRALASALVLARILASSSKLPMYAFS